MWARLAVRCAKTSSAASPSEGLTSALGASMDEIIAELVRSGAAVVLVSTSKVLSLSHRVIVIAK